MNRIQLKLLAALFGMLVVGASPLAAQEILSINFDSVPAGVVCDEVWVEDGVDVSFTTTTAEDCDGGGNCFFDYLDGQIWLFPSRLAVDFGEQYLIFRVEIDVEDFCGIGCTRAFLYNQGVQLGSAANATRGAPEVLVIDFGAEGVMADAIAVSSCEGRVLSSTIRVYSDVVSDDDSTWGDIKATYR